MERSKTFQMDTPPQTAAYHRARALREEGKSLRAIADILAAESVPLPPRRATKWSHTAVVRLFRQFDTPPAARPAPPPARQRPVVASPPAPAPQPPPPAHIARDMPPLGGPPWIPEGWRPRLLLGLLVLALLGTGGAAFTTWQELQTWRGVWEVMTPAERADFNKRIRAASSPTKAPPGDS